jgi:hypothetical protein
MLRQRHDGVLPGPKRSSRKQKIRQHGPFHPIPLRRPGSRPRFPSQPSQRGSAKCGSITMQNSQWPCYTHATYQRRANPIRCCITSKRALGVCRCRYLARLAYPRKAGAWRLQRHGYTACHLKWGSSIIEGVDLMLGDCLRLQMWIRRLCVPYVAESHYVEQQAYEPYSKAYNQGLHKGKMAKLIKWL